MQPTLLIFVDISLKSALPGQGYERRPKEKILPVDQLLFG